MLGTALVRCSSEAMTDWRSKAPRPKLDQELKNIMDREPNMPTYQEMLEQKRAVCAKSMPVNRRVSTSKGRFLSTSASRTRSTRDIPGAVHIPADSWRCGSKRLFAIVTHLSSSTAPVASVPSSGPKHSASWGIVM